MGRPRAFSDELLVSWFKPDNLCCCEAAAGQAVRQMDQRFSLPAAGPAKLLHVGRRPQLASNYLENIDSYNRKRFLCCSVAEYMKRGRKITVTTRIEKTILDVVLIMSFTCLK